MLRPTALQMAILHREITAWHDRRHAQQATIRWQFSVQKAPTLFARLYPSLSAPNGQPKRNEPDVK